MEEPPLEKELTNILDQTSRSLVLSIPAPLHEHQVVYIKIFMNVRAQVALRPWLQPATRALTFTFMNIFIYVLLGL